MGSSFTPSARANHVFQQARGQNKEHKVKKAKAKADKEDVEIHQRMTVAALAKAMNRDTGEPGPGRAGPAAA